MADGDHWVTVTRRAAVGVGEVMAVEAGGKPIALYNVDGTIYASDNVCTHAYAHLSDGWLDGDVIECPLHAGRFEVKTGKGLGPPVPCDLKVYPVRVVGEDVQVQLSG
ncbi:MAG TPA: non-heme iron oxygenase ferredoxin subunit [Stellaceae bacterium]|nr:non-heme iron oxygenase ferredoxin subunit [Stellaceae bacterium]